MTIKEVETRTGLTRSNIRFYEKEKLIAVLLADTIVLIGILIAGIHSAFL